MNSKEWLSVMQQAEDYDHNLTPLIIKYGELLISELTPTTQPVSREGRSLDEKNFDVRIKARIDRILRESGAWDLLLSASNNWTEYDKLRNKIFSDIGEILPTDLLPHYASQSAPLKEDVKNLSQQGDQC